MASAKGPLERASLLQAELIRRCQVLEAHDGVSIALSGMIEHRAGRIRVRALTERSGFSQRAVLMKFDDCVGLTPKQQSRLTRLRAAVIQLVENPELEHAQVALGCGFYDEAHMIHDFHALLGLSPGAFLARRSSFGPKSAPALGRSAIPRREQALHQLLGPVAEWTGGCSNLQLDRRRGEHDVSSAGHRARRTGGVS